MNNALDLLQRAATRLSQEGSIKDRLADAYASHLVDVDVDDLPDIIRNDFAELCEAMHRAQPLPRESVVRASVRKMSNDEAGRYAALVVRAFAALARAEVAGVAMRRTVRKPGATPVVPLFAAEG
ncbi:MAG: hypothetical protein ABIQ86_03275 [Steroidobacteraceae bacterium]